MLNYDFTDQCNWFKSASMILMKRDTVSRSAVASADPKRVIKQKAKGIWPMYPSQPNLRPLNPEGTLYAITDGEGRTIGTGSRDVCELLLLMIVRQSEGSRPLSHERRQLPHRNVRAAIVI